MAKTLMLMPAEEANMDEHVRLAIQFLLDPKFPKTEEGLELVLAHMREEWHFAERLSGAKMEPIDYEKDEELRVRPKEA